MARIEIIGYENLGEKETEDLYKIILSKFDKIVRAAGEVAEMKIKIRVYHEEGNSHEYSIHTEIRIKTRKFCADSDKWVFTEALRESFDKITAQLDREFEHNHR